MGIPGSANLLLAAAEAESYQLQQSLRFNDSDSAHLSKTSTAGTQTAWTWSCWVKATRFDGTAQAIFGSSPAGTLYNDIGFDGGQFRFRQYHSSGGGNSWELKTTARYRDPSAWYHIVLRFDSAQSTSSNRVKIWINGAQVTDFANETYPGQNINSLINSQYEHGIGKLESTFDYYFDGYLAEMHFVDNDVTLTPEDFGEYDNNGIWRPIEVTGLTYGTRGFYLTFDPTATNGIGHDHSGNGLNWTPSNLTTSGGGTDVMSDTPTTNWCTLNPLAVRPSYVPTFSEGNLKVTHRSGTGQYSHCGSTFAFKSDDSSGFYCEVQNGAQSYGGVSLIVTDYGVHNLHPDVSNGFSTNTNGGIGYDSNGYIRNFGTTIDYTSSASYNGGSDILGIAVKDNKVWFSINGSWIASGNPSTGANPVITLSSAQTFFVGSYGQGSRTFIKNFGQREFAYPPGTSSATDYFNAVTYTGNGSTQSITGVGFQPDLVWIKCRSVGTDHVLTDVVRGATKTIRSNVANAEYTQSDALTSFDSDGFSLGDDNSGGPAGNFNINGRTYVAWCWKAGGTASSNTDGTITSSVSANQDAAFSVVTYTGTTDSTPSVGHGLDSAPDVVIIKNRTSNSTSWAVYLSALGSSKYLVLNSSSGSQSNGWISAGTSTISFSTGSSWTHNNANDYVAYCFAEKEGVSKFGTYTGNGNNDGPQIYTGFKPALVIIKRSDSTGNWFMFDTARGDDVELYPDSSSAEATYDTILLTNTGFKLRSSTSDRNANGGTFIYMAFAENFSADTDFKALNTKNLPAPDIADGSQYFNTVTYTGNGSSTHAITGVGFQPNFSWVKRRNVSSNHVLQDSVRGITANNGNQLVSNSTVQENSNANGHIGSYDSDGFTLEDGTSSGFPRSGTNDNGGTYVAWLWKAGTASGSSNTAGSITSTVSANPSAGFSIVTYDSNPTGTVGHGLGVAPELIIEKKRNVTGDWLVTTNAIDGSLDYLKLNTTNAAASAVITAPTSTVFTPNASGDSMVAYCFASVEGYSKFGSYTGNGSSDGPFVFLGFKPSFLVIKRSDSTESWLMFDSTRETYNPTDDVLWANLSNAESANYTPQDFLSNGFKIRTSSTSTNASGGTYIFMAFSENPFGGDGVSPATAR